MLGDCRDVIIIGSGFAGSVAAARLVGSGLNIAMLERGPWRDTQANRDLARPRRAPLPSGWRLLSHGLRAVHSARLPSSGLTLNRKGVFELHVSNNLDALCTSQVGGGSHVYGALNMRPPNPDYWSGHHPELSAEQMAVYYDEIFKEMDTKLPSQFAGFANTVSERFEDNPAFVSEPAALDITMGLKLSDTLSPAQQSCSGLLGSFDGTKVTVDQLFLKPAIERGLTLHDLCEVTDISCSDTDQGRRYTVFYKDQHGSKQQMTSAVVILGAGTLNTLKLLFSNRDKLGAAQGMPALGKRFGGNGDFSALWHHPKSSSDLSEGLPTRGKVLLSETVQGQDEPWPSVVEGGLPYSAQLPPLPFLRGFSRRTTLLAGMGDDAMVGQVRYVDGRLHIDYPEQSQVPIFARIRRAIDLIGKQSRLKVTHLPKPMTMHPMGGACVGADPQRGVIDHTGQVFGCPGLYVADGAALPQSLGCGPSMTIAAWAKNVAHHIHRKISTDVEAGRPG